MQRRKFKCKLLVHLILVVNIAVSVKGDDVFAIMGRQTSMPCYDPATANGFESLFVKVDFTSPDGKTSFGVCHYQPGNQDLQNVDSNYQGRIGFTSVGAMTINSVSLTDEGVYTCTSNAFGITIPLVKTNLSVYVAPIVEVRKIEDPLLSGSDELQAAACTASNGKPPASVEWMTDRNLLFNESKSTSNVATDEQLQGVQTVEKILHIRPTKFYNGKSFFCVVKHPGFEEDVNKVVVLNVTYPPEKAVVIVNNDREGLTCESEGNPPPTITWLMPPIAPAPTFRGKTVMLISPQDPARSNDSYTCVANNGISPDQRTTVTTAFAVTYVEITQQANVGAIVGGVIGGLALLAIIVLLVYVFVLKPSREKDTGPYQYSGTTMLYKENSGGSRPTIEHANESLNRNRPPSPTGPPPEDKMDRSDTSSESGSDEGNHDVDVEVNPATNLVDPDRQDNAEIGGITSRASVNFQARRKRPSTSPAHRQSRSENHMPRKEESPVPNPRQNVRYDTPPGNDYDDDDDQLIQDERYQGYPSEEYDDRYQPQYVGYPSGRQPPRRMDSLPQHEPKYTEIDHTGYQGGHRRPQFEEPVEYAQIRHGYSHVV